MRLETLWRILIGALWVLPAVGGAAGHDDPRIVAVSGIGEIQVTPDRAEIPMGVEARRPDLQGARTEVNRIVDAFLALCDDLGVARRQIRSANLNVRPEYDWNNQSRERRLTGYFVSRQLSVDLRDLGKLGPLMEGAVSLGVNQAQPPRLDVGNRDELRREALANAAQDARRNAETLAETLGASVGPIRRVASSDVAFQPPPVRPFAAEAMRASAAPAGGGETYETGEIKIEARVTAEFDLIVN